MGDPYLSSDESLILSTHNICIDGVSLDLMLTSRRLILIDNSVNPFQLRTIPLESIITVFAGTDVKGDPIITLSHMDPTGTGAPHPMDFIFIRQKGEQRAKECKEWASTLVNLSAGARNGALSAGTLPYDPVKVIQPQMSATYRIETFSPRKTVTEEYPVRAEPVPTEDLLIIPADDEIPAGTHAPPYQENTEMGESFDISRLPPPDLEEKGMPVTKEPVSSPPVMATESDEIPVITETEEPVPSPMIIATESDEKPAITETEEPVPSPLLIATEADENPEIKETEKPVSSSLEMAIDAEKNTVITETEEPVSSPLVMATETDEKPVITETEEPVSSPLVKATEADEKPSNMDAAQAWADAVRTVTTLLPVIPLTMASDTIPAVENIDDRVKADADQISTPPKVPVAEIIKDDRSVDTIIQKCPLADEPVEPLALKADPVPAAISPPALKIPKSTSPTFQIAAIVVIILLVLGAAVISSFYLSGSGEIPPPVVVPVITVQSTPSPLPTIVPADGVWVRIESPGFFIGEVGNTELMHPVSGSGVRLYKILWSDRLVKVSAQKQENSGDTLLIEIYKNGTLLKRSSTRTPMGSIYILIDPITGQPPGIKL